MPRWTGVASMSDSSCATPSWLFHALTATAWIFRCGRVWKDNKCPCRTVLWLVYLVYLSNLKPISRMRAQKSIETRANASGKQRNIIHLLAGSETKLFSNYQRLRFHAMLHVKLLVVSLILNVGELMLQAVWIRTSYSASRRPWLTFNLDRAQLRPVWIWKHYPSNTFKSASMIQS